MNTMRQYQPEQHYRYSSGPVGILVDARSAQRAVTLSIVTISHHPPKSER